MTLLESAARLSELLDAYDAAEAAAEDASAGSDHPLFEAAREALARCLEAERSLFDLMRAEGLRIVPVGDRSFVDTLASSSDRYDALHKFHVIDSAAVPTDADSIVTLLGPVAAQRLAVSILEDPDVPNLSIEDPDDDDA